jgi:hypothetical protein
MKKRLTALTTMIFVTLFVISLGEAVTFRFVEDPPSPPPHAAGEVFTVKCVIDASDLASEGAKVGLCTLVIDYDSNGVQVNNTPPFTVGDYMPNAMIWENTVVDSNTIKMTIASFPATGPAVDGGVMATVEFIQTVPGPARIDYVGGTIYTKSTAPGDQIPTVIAIEVCLPVVLSTFTAIPSDRGVVVKWRTESELNNLGFDVYRSENPDGKFAKVNPAYIKGAGTDSIPHDYQLVDESAVVGKTYYYYIESISFSGERERSHIIKVIIDASGKARVTGLMQPAKPALLQNFPNPFNPETWIPFHLADDADVTIRIFDIRGKQIRAIHLGQTPAGYYETRGNAAFWDGRDSYGQEVSSGIYFYNLTAGTFSATKKLTIIK